MKLCCGRGFSLHVFTLGTDIWAQIGRSKSGLVYLTVSWHLGHERPCADCLGCRHHQLGITGLPLAVAWPSTAPYGPP